MSNCKGIILAGGFGTRLLPATKVTNKHLLPVYSKPMVYFPIDTLTKAGLRDIMILTGSECAGDFIDLLGDGTEFGANFTFKPQRGAGGIAEALGLCRGFANGGPVVVILGDNIFDEDITQDVKQFEKDPNSAMIFLKKVPDPQRFGVATIKNDKVVEIIEKPLKPQSSFAVTGLYFYPSSVWSVIENIKPSARGEREISDVNRWYVEHGLMKHRIIESFWSDAGTPESLYRSATHIREKVYVNS